MHNTNYIEISKVILLTVLSAVLGLATPSFAAEAIAESLAKEVGDRLEAIAADQAKGPLLEFKQWEISQTLETRIKIAVELLKLQANSNDPRTKMVCNILLMEVIPRPILAYAVMESLSSAIPDVRNFARQVLFELSEEQAMEVPSCPYLAKFVHEFPEKVSQEIKVYAFSACPTEAFQLFLQQNLPRPEWPEWLGLERDVSDYTWRVSNSIAVGNLLLEKARAAIEKLSVRQEWWSRAYAAQVLVEFPLLAEAEGPSE